MDRKNLLDEDQRKIEKRVDKLTEEQKLQLNFELIEFMEKWLDKIERK